MSSLLNQGVATGQAGYGLYGQLEKVFAGNPKKVSFVQRNVTLIQFDASLNESHGVSTAPTEFAVEDGQNICDHIRVNPLELQLSVVKTDTPIDTKDEFLRSLLVSGGAAAGGPLGILGGAAAAGLNAKYTSLKAQGNSLSPSQNAYEVVLRLAAGLPDTAGRTVPQIFDVVTSLRRYASMVIKSVSVEKDGSTGTAVVFQLTLQQVRLVSSQTVEVSAPAQPALSAVKKKLAEKESEDLTEAQIAARQGRFNGLDVVGQGQLK